MLSARTSGGVTVGERTQRTVSCCRHRRVSPDKIFVSERGSQTWKSPIIWTLPLAEYTLYLRSFGSCFLGPWIYLFLIFRGALTLEPPNLQQKDVGVANVTERLNPVFYCRGSQPLVNQPGPERTEEKKEKLTVFLFYSLSESETPIYFVKWPNSLSQLTNSIVMSFLMLFVIVSAQLKVRS